MPPPPTGDVGPEEEEQDTCSQEICHLRVTGTLVQAHPDCRRCCSSSCHFAQLRQYKSSGPVAELRGGQAGVAVATSLLGWRADDWHWPNFFFPF